MITSEGFVKLYREGLALLELSLPAFALLTQIALRANRMDPAYSIYQLKANEALVGDHKKIGLSRQQYRDAVLRLEAYTWIARLLVASGSIRTRFIFEN